MVKRRYIQLLAALIYNLNFTGIIQGEIYKGQSKGICVPGLNCYSCPAAIAACPLGSLQTALSEVKYKMPFYTVGMLILFGVLLGRGVCAFLCPFGFIQELLYKIPSPKLPKSKFTRYASMSKYAFLLIFVLLLPLFFLVSEGVGVPAFCKYICPAGMLEGGILLVLSNESLQSAVGVLFKYRLLLLAVVIISSVFVFRAFCRFICPLGAIYSLFNRCAIFGLRVDAKKCTGCNSCVNSCRLDTCRINDRECIRCGDCSALCENEAIAGGLRWPKDQEESS